MMDSQETTQKNVEQSAPQEVQNEVTQNETNVQPAEASASNADTATVEEAREKHLYSSKEEVLERVKEIARTDEEASKAELDHLKTAFYHLLGAEKEAAEKEYIENGGDPMQYKVPADETEDAFKAEMNIIKERRQIALQKLEEEKLANLKRKQEIIERIKELTTTPDEATTAFAEVKELQAEWRERKPVPAESASDLWNQYKLCQEQFYDLLKLNFEAREYDFKKNLEMKTALCEAAEKLGQEEDVVSAFHQLQELHNQYREIGPVAKELRADIWARFKAASTVVNKRHADHFEAIRKKEEENLEKKAALCDQIEAIDTSACNSSADWEQKTKDVLDIQAAWKTIGFAPKSMNVKIFERFRTACDQFFTAKNEFFTQMKARFAENIAKKEELIRKAKELQDSTEWRQTTDKLIALQKEWKTIGMVPRKIGDQLWNDFLTACNTFFDARNAATADERNEQKENLEKKKGIIAQLKELVDNAVEDLQERVQSLTEEYNKTGHVPFKDKDALFREYHDTLDILYKKLNKTRASRRLNAFKDNLKEVAKRGENAVETERQKMQRRFNDMKQELETYENNLNFLSASSKKGNSLIDEMNKKVEKLRDELELMKQKLKAME